MRGEVEAKARLEVRKCPIFDCEVQIEVGELRRHLKEAHTIYVKYHPRYAARVIKKFYEMLGGEGEEEDR